MKAMQFKSYGGTERLRPVDLPPPRPPDDRQLLMEVMATSVNPIDWKLHGGYLRWIRPIRFPSIPCFDVAAVVKTVGSAVGEYRPGDRVFGMLPMRAFGAAAEYVTVDVDYVTRIPDALGFPDAAGIPLAGMTALQALRDRGQLQAGQRVLVVGAAGGVGHYAVQIGKALKAHVTGICSARNITLVRELGADDVMDYGRGDGLRTKEPFDLILDTVTNLPFRHWQAALTARGQYVSLLPTVDLGLQTLRLAASSRRRIRLTVVNPQRQDLEYLGDLAQRGQLRTVVDHIYPLSQLADALEKSKQGHARGKIIISIKDDSSPRDAASWCAQPG